MKLSKFYQKHFSGNARSLWMGVLWALTSGTGVAVALLQGAVGPLIGVAISASLLPPVVNCVSIQCTIHQWFFFLFLRSLASMWLQVISLLYLKNKLHFRCRIRMDFFCVWDKFWKLNYLNLSHIPTQSILTCMLLMKIISWALNLLI